MTEAPTLSKQRNPLGSVDPFRGKWRIRRTDPKTGKRRSHGVFDTRERAWLELARIAVDSEGVQQPTGSIDATEELPEDHGGQRQAAKTVREWVVETAASRKRKLKPETYRNQQSILNKWVLPKWGETLLEELTPDAIEEWHDTLASETGAPNRRNIYSCFSAYLALAVKRDVLMVNPAQAEGAWQKATPKRPRRTSAEARALIEHVPEDLRVMLLLSADVHLRPSEARGLNCGDFNPRTQTLRIERQDPKQRWNPETGELHPLPKPKDDSVREVPLTPEMVPVLLEHLSALAPRAGSAPMFPGHRAERVSASYVRKHWLRAREAVKDLTWHTHDLRGVGLTALAEMGFDRKDIKARSGHRSDVALDAYLWTDARRDAEVAVRYGTWLRSDEAGGGGE